jgi:hypothetical protein
LSTEPRDVQQVRLAKNQALFREVNERMEALVTEFGTLEAQHSFVCECSNTDCATQLELSHQEYERIRANPARFVIAPGHELEIVEDVVATTPTYTVVEKIETAREVAIASNPRQ